MAFAISTTTAAVLAGGSVLAAGVGAAGASGMFGGGGGGGGGGGSLTASTQAQMDQYIKDTQSDADRLISQVSAIASAMQTNVGNLSTYYAQNASAQENNAVNRIIRANQILQSQANERSSTFTKDIQQAIDDLAYGTEVLNLGSREDTLKQLNAFKTEVQDIEKTALERSGAEFDRAEADTAKLTQELQDGTKSLGDLFLDRASQAQQQYLDTMGTATSMAPDRLAEFSRAADQLSQSAVKTRMDMLATADPRALELSQIADNNAAAMMSGQISADVQANLARSSAMQALQGGFGASSEMGRGLTARDLGLTSLDLQQRGMQDYERQRMLNFNTRVAGLQTDAGALLRDNQTLLSEQGRTLLGSQLQTAQSDRDQRFGALDRGYQTQTGAVGARRDQAVGLARDIYGTRTNAAGTVLNENLSNLNDIYGNRYNTLGTMFNTRTALGEQLFKTGIGLSSDMYGTAVNTASDLYSTNINVAGDIFRTNAASTTNAANLIAQAETNRLDALTRARGSAAGTMVAAAQQDSLNAQQQTASRNAMWGSLANTGASLAGSIFGNYNFGGGGGFGGSRTAYQGPLVGTYTGGAYSTSAAAGPPSSLLK
jgi:hypothetical protein